MAWLKEGWQVEGPVGKLLTTDGFQIAPHVAGAICGPIKLGIGSRFILRVERDRRGPFYMVEDVGPQAA
ncbi:hypothetical protein ACHMW5_31855 [Azospirillum melinis]|uniref:hypothetical protein n=1 Tax=Azospirillum melinis TaxID=328839 RepID=UPI0037572B6C